ncbi:BMP family lipoprotein [Amphibacillus sp. Q70]|uniref:BMP family lipoprotein n=1 Tax=Amphibacillus sp. Q70 TaxID=3453416 RepID=UPI003F82F5DE
MRLKVFQKSLIVGLLVFILVGCSNEEGNNDDSTDGADYSVALITSEGGLGDRSFNDSGHEGLKKAEEEFGISTRVVEPRDVSEGETYFRQLADAGIDLVITMDLGHQDALESIAPDYPDTQFAIVNTIAEGENISSIMFKEHEASFLAGALAAMVTTEDGLEQTNNDEIISFVGGLDSPGITIFLTGFTSGAEHINENIKVLSAYTNSFADPARGKEVALSQISEGSDIIFQAAGATGEGVIQAAEEKNVFAIGVDSDQDSIAPGYVLTSVMKRVDNAVYNLIQSGLENDSYESLYELGLKEEGVQLSPMEHTRDLLPEEYLEEVEKLKEDIINGDIVVEDTRL